MLSVVRERTIVSYETFRDILAGGRTEDVLRFLREKNLVKGEMGFSFSDIRWMLGDKDTYDAVVRILRERCIYSHHVW